MKAKPKSEYASFHPADCSAWREWLSKNNAHSQGVWLTLRKKSSPRKGILLDEALDEAVSFGWIDSRLNVQDQDYYRLLFTPRKPGGTWSQNNKQRVEKLKREGKMTAVGLAKVEAAMQDGSWDRLTSIDELRVPRDLQYALATNTVAQKHYELLTDSAKKQVLWWIESAKTAATRAKRIQESVEKLRTGEEKPSL